MDGSAASQVSRPLAEIESDLLKAEEAIADADARFKEAECDRGAALNTIDKHQMEVDEAIAELRQRSIPGSKWCREGGKTKDFLYLRPEKRIENETASIPSNLASVATKFDGSGAVAQHGDGSPVLRVAKEIRA